MHSIEHHLKTLQISLDTIQKSFDCFIETGTNSGDGCVWALDADFQQIISIELLERYYLYSKKRLEGTICELFLGNSKEVLPKIVESMNTSCFFWFDAHPTNSDSRDPGIPLYCEIDLLKSLDKRNQHIVLIDDVDFAGTSHDGNIWLNISRQKLIEHLEESFVEVIDDYEIVDSEFFICLLPKTLLARQAEE